MEQLKAGSADLSRNHRKEIKLEALWIRGRWDWSASYCSVRGLGNATVLMSCRWADIRSMRFSSSGARRDQIVYQWPQAFSEIAKCDHDKSTYSCCHHNFF
jgi:hypothetical protein